MEQAFLGLTFSQLEIFFAVAQSGGFARAGEMLHLSQPAVSKSIARMEEVLGLRLFRRSTRAITLTEAGRQLYDAWQPCVCRMQDAYQRAIAMHRPRTLRIGLPNTIRASRFFDAVAAGFTQTHPGVTLEVESDYMSTLLAQLRTGAYDVIFLPDFERYSLDGLCWCWAAKENAYVFLPKDDPLSSRGSVTLRELADHEFVTLSDSFTPDYLRDLRERFAAQGLTLRVSRSYRKAYDLRVSYRVTDGVLLHDAFFEYQAAPDAVRLPVTDQENGILCVWDAGRVSREAADFVQQFTHNETL